MQNETQYSTAIFVFDVISFIGYVVILFTLFALFGAGVMLITGKGTIAIYGMTVLSGLLVIIFGMLMIGGAQVMRAIVDTADNTRKLLHLQLKNK